MINWIVTSSVLILVVIALRFLLRGKISLRLQYALWGIVLLRLLMPFEIGTSDVSLMNAVEQMPVVQEFEIIQEVDEIEYVRSGVISGHNPENKINETVAVNKTPEDFARMNQVLNIRELLNLVWRCGAVLMLLAFLLGNGRFSAKVKKSRTAFESEDSGITVYISDAVETPCLFGLFKPAIYVTPEAASDETVLHHTIEHETTHYLHKDHIWSFLRCIALAIHWYNPMVWLAVKLSKADGELACDEATIGRIGEGERYAYGQTLIEMTRPGREILLGTATTMTGSKSTLKERIELIAKKPKMAVYTLAVVVVITAVAVVCTFSGAEDQEFYKWLKSLEPDEIAYAEVYRGTGVTRESYMLDQQDILKLTELLNTTEKNNLYEKETAGADSENINYARLKLTMKDGQGNSSEYIFHNAGAYQIYMTFDSDTADEFGDIGKTCWISSLELSNYISELAEKEGNFSWQGKSYLAADIDHDGEDEIITSKLSEDGLNYTTKFSEQDGTDLIETIEDNTRWNALAVCTIDEEDYILFFDTLSEEGLNRYFYKVIYPNQLRGYVWETYAESEIEYDTFTVDNRDEIKQFFEEIKLFMDNSVLLFCSHNGSVTLGPARSDRFTSTFAGILDNLNEWVIIEEDVTAVMREVRAGDFTNPEEYGTISAEELADALNQAVSREITLQEAVSMGYDVNKSEFWYLRGAYLEKSRGDYQTGEDMHLSISCSLPENIVKVSYGKLGVYDVAYFHDETLYRLIRHMRDYETEIDRAAFNRFEAILTAQMEKTLQNISDNPGGFYDYELLDFHKVWEFQEDGGGLIELYDFDYTLLMTNPNLIGMAGGMWIDGSLRLRGFNGGGQFAVLYRNGEMTAYHFMGNDFFYTPGIGGDEEFAREHLINRLNWSEENGGNGQ